MKILLALKNGQFVKNDDPRILHLLDASAEHTEGVYESIRTYRGIPFRLDEHLARLEKSAQLLNLELPEELAVIEQWTIDVVQKAAEPEQFIFIGVTAEDIVIVSRELKIDEKIYTKGYRVMTVESERVQPEAKTLNSRSISGKARALAEGEGFDEAILVNHRGECTEGAFSNFFWVKDGQVFTTHRDALPGVTQEAVIEIAGEMYPVEEAVLKKEELSKADELFLTMTSRGIVPVGKPGPVTRELMERFQDLTERECSF